MSDAVQVKPEKMGKFEKYQVESAVDTLIRAEDIKQDPELMKEVMKLVDTRKRSISSIADMKDAARDMRDEPDDEDDEE